MKFIRDNKIISLVVLAVVVLGAGWVVFSGRSNEGQDVFKASIVPVAQVVEEKALSTTTEQAELSIDNGITSQSFELSISASTTAFDLLKQAQEISGLKVETIDYGSMGLLVDSIGGKKNGQDNKNWIYYVNSELASISVDKKVIKPEDKVEFKFEPSPF